MGGVIEFNGKLGHVSLGVADQEVEVSARGVAPLFSCDACRPTADNVAQLLIWPNEVAAVLKNLIEHQQRAMLGAG